MQFLFLKKLPSLGQISLYSIDSHFSPDQSQLWKVDGSNLKNKAAVWISSDEYNIKPSKSKLVYIENNSTGKVMGVFHDGKVIEEDFVEGKPRQLWRKGEPDDNGYFTLKTPGSKKVLTAVSASELHIKGDLS